MRTAGSVTVAASGTGVISFGPVGRGRHLIGIYLWYVDTSGGALRAQAEIVTSAQPITAVNFGDGESVVGQNPATLLERLEIPANRLVFVPLDAEFDRQSFLAVRYTEVGTLNDINATACLQTGRGSSFPDEDTHRTLNRS